MPNQLSIPFKRTYIIPIKQAAREYLHTHGDSHPDAFKFDLNRWEALRKEGVGGVVHVDRVNAALQYHAQLVSILIKLPADIQLQIPYAPAFSPSALPITLQNLVYERAAVLFNLAALYSQLAADEDRSTKDGVKRASSHYQSAAGTLSFLITSTLPKLVYSPSDEDVPLDLTHSFVKSLEWLMLAQAQECVWQRAVMDNLKNGLIAKLAITVSSFYHSSITSIRTASPSIKHAYPSDWLAHLETKQYHFGAAAHYRKSIDDLEANKYGHELARLGEAHIAAKKGYDIARRGGVAPSVFQDIKSLLDIVQKNISRAERDNDLIYHQDIPSSSTLPPIQEVSTVQSAVPQGLREPMSVLGDESMIFGEILGWGAREAINIYNDNRDTLIKEKIFEVALELNEKANKTLQSLNLPSSLEALERPVGLPPSLLKKAEEVRQEEGPRSIESSIEVVQKLAQQDVALLNDAMDILDSEASEDEAVRKKKSVNRLPSHEANQELVQKEQRYRAILAQAAESDELVCKKWDEWEGNIVELTWEEPDLEASVPSSTISAGSSPKHPQTRIHARELRVLLESLDDVFRTRAQLVERAQRRAESDDIHPRIMKVATSFERWVEVQPVMFADLSDEELAKYDKFIQGITEGEQRQNDILQSIRARNELFLQSRKDDPSVKEREHALQSLDLAYHKYREIRRNLEEGIKFYNDLAAIFSQFKESCKTWSHARRQEIPTLSHAMDSMSIQDTDPGRTKARESPSTPKSPLQRKPGIKLPSLDSDEWQTLMLPPAPSKPAR